MKLEGSADVVSRFNIKPHSGAARRDWLPGQGGALGRRKFPLPLEGLLAGLGIKLMWDTNRRKKQSLITSFQGSHRHGFQSRSGTRHVCHPEPRRKGQGSGAPQERAAMHRNMKRVNVWGTNT